MKKIIFIILIVLLLTITNNVYAKVDDTLFVNRIYSDVYAVQEYKTGGHRMYKGSIYYMTKGNKTEIGYCIELGANLDAITYSSTNDYSRFNLTKEQSDYIRLVSYYGYEYQNHYDRNYYFAAQEIIWEYLTNDEIYWVSAEDYNASRINLEDYKNEIISLVNKHYIKPQFNNKTINYKDTIELIDENNVLEQYEIIDIKNATYRITNNKLYITSTNLDNVEITLARKINKTNPEMYYYASGSQSIISTGIVDNNQINYVLNNTGINLKINKLDKESEEYIKNSNVGFKLYDINNSKYINDKEYIINEDGYVVIPNINKGQYSIEEIDLGINDYLYNSDILEFEITDDNIDYDENYGYVYNVNFYNKKPTGTININKKGEKFVTDNNTYTYEEIKLENVTFEIITMQDIIYNNEEYTKGSIINNIKTNEEGLATIDNLPLGKYKIKEKEVDSNYELDNNEYEINLEYINPYTSVVNKTIDIKNYLKKSKLEIIKIDSNTNKKLEGVLIAIFDSKNNKIYEGKTNKEGKIVLDDLIYGTYYVQETKELSNYILDDYKYEVNFNENNREEKIIIKNNKIPTPPKTSNKNYNYILLCIISFLSLCLNKIKNMI